MKVRVWIAGADGPSRDFELLTAPCAGQRISITMAGKVEEGVVTNVTWHLQAIETAQNEIAIEGEPMGSVSLVHVICRPASEVLSGGFSTAEMDQGTETQGTA